MLSNLSKYHIILASNSPRRKELLAGLGLQFEVRTLKGIDESYPESLVGEQIPIFIANKKADAYQLSMAENELIITADTFLNKKDRPLLLQARYLLLLFQMRKSTIMSRIINRSTRPVLMESRNV